MVKSPYIYIYIQFIFILNLPNFNKYQLHILIGTNAASKLSADVIVRDVLLHVMIFATYSQMATSSSIFILQVCSQDTYGII